MLVKENIEIYLKNIFLKKSLELVFTVKHPKCV